MPTSVPGNKPRRGRRAQRAFTLIELMIVVALIAVASAVATMALRDPAASQLDREASRLSALLESARAQARMMGVAVRWEPSRGDQPGLLENAGTDFRFVGLPASLGFPDRWLGPEKVQVEIIGARAVALGPEPVIGAQRILLRLENQRLALVTDGLGPFRVEPDEAIQ